jgi:site-specific recombinase XerD
MQELINVHWTWREALTDYEETLRFSGRHADSTIRVRLNLLEKIADFGKAKGVEKPADINKVFLQEYFKSRKLAKSTRATQLRFISHFIDHLEENYVVIENCAHLIPTPKVPEKVKKIPNEHEISELYDSIFKHKKPAVLARDLVIVDLLLNPGLRVSELVGLKIRDVDLNEKLILITRKGGKEQELPIPEHAVDHIKEMLSYRPDYGDDDSLIVAQRRVKGKYQGLGIRGAQKLLSKHMLASFKLNKNSYGPHLLRHTGGTFLRRQGVDLATIQELFGHRDIKTTMIYQHTDLEDLQVAVASGKDYSKGGNINI